MTVRFYRRNCFGSPVKFSLPIDPPRLVIEIPGGELIFTKAFS
jgi:hypothetical protein